MIDKIAAAAGQGDAPGLLLQEVLGSGSTDTLGTRPISAAAGGEVNSNATGGNLTSGSASLAGTTVQMGAAGGLVFNITYDASVSSAPAGFTSAISDVVNYYESVFNDPITVNIDVGWGEVAGQALATGAIGESETNLGVFSYSQVKTALAADAKSADDAIAVAGLPGSDPTGGGSFVLATAEAKALGLGTSATVDGYVGFSSSANYTFDPNNRAVSGAYDFIGVAEHEISEVMGRIALLGTPLSGLSRTYTALDLFRYSSLGARQLVAGKAAYFSLDGGNTNLNNFNTLSSGDAGDWASGGGNDAYNASVTSGVMEPVTASDLRVLDVIGWDRGTARIDTPPVVTVTNSTVTASPGQIFAAASLFTASDPDGDAITQYDFWDTGGGGGRFLVSGVAQPTNGNIYVTASQLAQTTYQSGSGVDTLWVRANDSTQWSAWSPSFTVSANKIDTPPVVTVSNSNIKASPGQILAASSLFTASDPDGDAITQYDFWDTGGGGGHFLVSGVTQPTNRDIYVTAAQLAQTTYQSGSGTDTLWVRANDGTQWGAWSSSFTASANKIDTPPVVTPTNSNVTASPGQILAAASLFTASDPDGDAITQYDFWDTGSGGGHFLLSGATQPTNGDIYVAAAQLAQTTYQSGGGTDTLWVRANDGTQWSAWSPSFTVSANKIDTPPVVTVTNSTVTASPGQIFAASSLFTASDPDGDAITQYDFWDTGSGGGRFLVNGVTQPTNGDIYVNASQLAQTTYQSGNGTDTLWVRANDGTQWSAWSSSFTITGQAGHTLLAVGDHGPQATLLAHSY
jgi:hypothetical protein